MLRFGSIPAARRAEPAIFTWPLLAVWKDGTHRGFQRWVRMFDPGNIEDVYTWVTWPSKSWSNTIWRHSPKFWKTGDLQQNFLVNSVKSSAEWVSAAFSTTSGVPVYLANRHQASRSITVSPSTNHQSAKGLMLTPGDVILKVHKGLQPKRTPTWSCGPDLFWGPTCILLSLKPAAFNAARRSWSSSWGTVTSTNV